MNTNLSTSYTALQSDRERLTAQAERGWQAEQAAAGSGQTLTVVRLAGIATSIVNAIHEFVDPRGFAMQLYKANERLNPEDVSVLDAPAIAPEPAETMLVSEQPTGIVTTLPNLWPGAPDAVEAPAAA